MKKLPLFLLFAFFACVTSAQEICNNGIDDDGDGLVDLLDSDCTPTIYPLLANPSFERINQCPTFYSQLHYATGWFQPGPGVNGSSDVYHRCGGCTYTFSGLAPYLSRPIPDGVGFAGIIDAREMSSSGIWKEYLCAFPDRPLQKDSAYVLDFFLGFMTLSPATPSAVGYASFSPVTLSVFGHPNNSAIPYATPNNNSYRNCPIGTDPGWVELARFTVSGNSGEWVKARTEFTVPRDIAAVVIGPACEANPYGSITTAGYYGLDQLLLYRKDPYDLPSISRSGDICADTLTLTATTNLPVPVGNWQWYREGIALPGETADVLQLSRGTYGAGAYRVQLTVNRKRLLSAEVNVLIDDIDFDLTDSLRICAGDQIVVEPRLNTPPSTQCPVGYLWNDGLTNPGRTISAPGLYWFETNKDGCRKRDSVEVLAVSAPTVNLGADTTLCVGNALLLTAGNPGLQYQWQDNSTTPTLVVSKAGTYRVKVSIGECSVQDTIVVKYERDPQLRFSADTLLCKDEQKRLQPFVEGSRYSWNTGSTAPEIIVTQPGLYVLAVENSCGTITGSVQISRSDCTFWLPTAFTPNRDGRNDVFGLALYNFVRTYECRIFNRWGQLVFSSTDPAYQWDGRFKGRDAIAGVYAWTIQYSDWSGDSYLKKGTVALIR